MKRVVILLLALGMVAGGVVIYGQVTTFLQLLPQEPLVVNSVSPSVYKAGTPVSLDLRGTGFSSNTSVSLVMSISNEQAVAATFPIGGVFNESMLWQDKLFLGSNNDGLKVLDISQPRQPRLIKEYLPGRRIVDLYRADNLLIVSCGKMGIVVFWMQEDGSLIHVVDIPTRDVVTQCIYRDGYLYAAAGEQGLLIYDARRLDAIRILGHAQEDFFVTALGLFSDYLYLFSSKEQKAEILKIISPGVPEHAGSIELDYRPKDILIKDDRMYVGHSQQVTVLSLALPTAPSQIQAVRGVGSAEKLFPGRASIYISDSFSGLRALSVPPLTLSENFLLGSDLRTLVEYGDYLFTAGSESGLHVVEKASLSQKKTVSLIDTPGDINDIFIRDNIMYIADGRAGVLLVDLNHEPKILKRISTEWGAGFVSSGDRLYVAHGREGVELFDISEPEEPTLLAFWRDRMKARKLAIMDHFLVTSNGIEGLEVFDVRDPQNPILSDSVLNVHALQVVAHGRLLYLATKKQGLMIYEMTNDGKMKLASRLQAPFPKNRFDLPTDLDVVDGIAYIANGPSGLLLADVRNPDHPLIISELGLPGDSKGVHVRNGRAYVINGQYGLSVIDVSHPAEPFLQSQIEIPGLSRRFVLGEDVIYLTRNEGGVLVLPLPVAAQSLRFSSAGGVSVEFDALPFSAVYDVQASDGLNIVTRKDAVIIR